MGRHVPHTPHTCSCMDTGTLWLGTRRYLSCPQKVGVGAWRGWSTGALWQLAGPRGAGAQFLWKGWAEYGCRRPTHRTCTHTRALSAPNSNQGKQSWHGVVSALRCCQPGAGERFPTGEGMASRGDGSSEAGISLLPAVGSWQLTTASQTSLLPVSTASFSHRSLHRPSPLNAQLTPGFLGKPCGGANGECVNGEGTDDQISEGQGEPCSRSTLLWGEKGAQPLPTSHHRFALLQQGVHGSLPPADTQGLLLGPSARWPRWAAKGQGREAQASDRAPTPT